MRIPHGKYLLPIVFACLCVSHGVFAEGDQSDWKRVYEGYRDSVQKVLYAGACDFSVPAFVDIDGDDDLDLFIGVDTTGLGMGYPVYSRNDGTSQKPVWTIVSEAYVLDDLRTLFGDPDFCSPTFADMDGDGDFDLILGYGYGTPADVEGTFVAYFENTGDRTEPSWTLRHEDCLGGAVPMYHARPALADVDGDDDLDLVIGVAGGRIAFYENISEGDVPEWLWQTDDYSEIYIAANQVSVFAVSPFFCDINADGIVDLFIGDVSGRINYFRGYRDGDATLFSFESDNYNNIDVSHNAAPAFADIDGDGTLDSFIGSFSGEITQFANSGTPGHPEWDESSSVELSIDVGAESFPELADLDGDGDDDLFIAGYGDLAGVWSIAFYRNIGTPWLPNWQREPDLSVDLSFIAYPSPRFVDIDGDDDLDLYIGDLSGLVYFYRNEGTNKKPYFVEDIFEMIDFIDGFFACPAFADMDGDGDYDLWVSYNDFDTSEGAVLYCENISETAHPEWGPPVDWSDQFSLGDFPTIDVEDIDNDGLNDVVVTSDTTHINLHYCLQTSPTLILSDPVPISIETEEISMTVTLADLDGDLNTDLVFGETFGGIQVYRNPAQNIMTYPHHTTLLEDQSLSFLADSFEVGEWEIVENRTGGSIDPGTGVYTAGHQDGIDVIRFTIDPGDHGVSYVNVVTQSQMSASGKAVIVTGSIANDPLWDTTNDLANFIYRTLLFRGFSRENIYYLNHDIAQDVDGDGDNSNDIDVASTLANLEYALGEFVSSGGGAPSLFVYLIDHGDVESESGEGYFKCNEDEELYASDLGDLLDELQSNDGVTTLTVVVDFCMSGSFLTEISGAPEGKTRIAITSADPYQPSFFSARGLISFTESFVTGLYMGLTVGESFAMGAGAMDTYQQPQMDDDGDGAYHKHADGDIASRTIIGADFIAGADKPQIAKISPNETIPGGETAATVWASDVSSVYPIERVWAMIIAPDFSGETQLDPSTPVVGLPQMDLEWNEITSRYEATTDTFKQLGAHKVNIYAQDMWDSVSYPKQTYVNQTDGDEQVIIVCGDGNYDLNSPWEFSDFLAQNVYQTARARWITDEKITYLSSSIDQAVDASPTKANLSSAISSTDGGSKLTVYLVGKGDADAFDIDGDGDDADDVTPSELDEWLDALQSDGTTLVIVVLDFTESGNWVSSLTPPTGSQRITFTSCSSGENSWCEAGGLTSFSQWFFNEIFNGNNMRDAFNEARNAIRGVTNEAQNPLLDDDGSGTADRGDGNLAKTTYLGAAFVTGADLPQIGLTSGDIDATVGESATLWASDIAAPQGIKDVWITIFHPSFDPVADLPISLPLTYNTGNERFECEVPELNEHGKHTVLFYVRDKNENLSIPICHTILYGVTSVENWFLY